MSRNPNKITDQLFSVGTRFIVNSKKRMRNCFSIFVYDPQKKCMKTSAVPFQFCKEEKNNETYQQKANDFVKLLRSWMSDKGIIPYVWGGCSFTGNYQMDHFEMVEQSILGKKSEFYMRPSSNESPKIGFDCTGLVARAAQICGLPYYFKNSTTVMKNIESFSDIHRCVEGDLIWIPGHIMVIASTVNNTIIEARAYDHGFGKIQEIPLSEVFEGITNFEQLHIAYKKNQPLQRLDKQGKVIQVINSFKLLKLESIFNKKMN
jgi:hypothetical protein